MALNIVEFFGYAPEDISSEARSARGTMHCPFLDTPCQKTLNDGTISGACTVKQVHSSPVICCPIRLYADDYRILHEVAEVAFGDGIRFIRPSQVRSVTHDGRNVVVFGRGAGGEMRLPTRGGRGGYFVDWILSLIGSDGNIRDFVAVEVQSIDTTGNYRGEREAYMHERAFPGRSRAGLNWENVHKRILPQIIYKGHVLRRERLCTKGMFFVCPAAVYQRIQDRLGRELLNYPAPHPGALTFRWYDVGPPVLQGSRRHLNLGGQFITTIDQVAVAFTAPRDLPPPNVYEEAVRAALAAAHD